MTLLRLPFDPLGHCVHAYLVCPCSSLKLKPWGTLWGTMVECCLWASCRAVGFSSFKGSIWNQQLHFWVNGLLEVFLKPTRLLQRCHWWDLTKTDSPKESSRTRLWNRTKQCHLVQEKQGKILARIARQHLILNLYLYLN